MKTGRTLYLLFGLYLAALLRITVFRPGCFSHGLFSGRLVWEAFAYYAELAQRGSWRYFLYLFGGNLAWFAPAGIWAALRGRGFAAALLLGFGLSVLVESGQFLLGSGVSELDDLILNTVGAGLGWLAAFFPLRRSRQKTT